MNNIITIKFLEALNNRGFSINIIYRIATKKWMKMDGTPIATSILTWLPDETTHGEDAIENIDILFGGPYATQATMKEASSIYALFLDEKEALHRIMGDEQ